jgi:hypothetical protein
MTHLSRCIVYLIVCGTLPANVHAQTTTVIPANEAAAHVGEYATVEGVVAKLFTSKAGNTFLNIGAAYPNQTFTGWIPPHHRSPNLLHFPRSRAWIKFASISQDGTEANGN